MLLLLLQLLLHSLQVLRMKHQPLHGHRLLVVARCMLVVAHCLLVATRCLLAVAHDCGSSLELVWLLGRVVHTDLAESAAGCCSPARGPAMMLLDWHATPDVAAAAAAGAAA